MLILRSPRRRSLDDSPAGSSSPPAQQVDHCDHLLGKFGGRSQLHHRNHAGGDLGIVAFVRRNACRIERATLALAGFAGAWFAIALIARGQ